jgi:hypothetical protein
MDRQRTILTGLWWGWGLALIVVLVGISYSAPALEDPSQAWGWLLPNITPTMLLVGAVAYQQKRAIEKRTKPHPLFGIALGASIVYLGLLSIAVVSVLMTTDPIKTLQMSNLWLGPLQGLCASVLGIFFTDGSKGTVPETSVKD